LTTDCIKKCIEHGVNYFDTAESYGGGLAEIQMGRSFKELGIKREDIVISTKIFFGEKGLKDFSNINNKGLSRKHIIEGAKNSLKRLQLDYADIIFAHRADPHVPLEETCRAFSWLVDRGLTIHWGTSEWPSNMIVEAFDICEKYGLNKPVAE
jgi:aryl-alcohol dehydrogenase-like predicted oxidoreductase